MENEQMDNSNHRNENTDLSRTRRQRGHFPSNISSMADQTTLNSLPRAAEAHSTCRVDPAVSGERAEGSPSQSKGTEGRFSNSPQSVTEAHSITCSRVDPVIAERRVRDCYSCVSTMETDNMQIPHYKMGSSYDDVRDATQSSAEQTSSSQNKRGIKNDQKKKDLSNRFWNLFEEDDSGSLSFQNICDHMEKNAKDVLDPETDVSRQIQFLQQVISPMKVNTGSRRKEYKLRKIDSPFPSPNQMEKYHHPLEDDRHDIHNRLQHSIQRESAPSINFKPLSLPIFNPSNFCYLISLLQALFYIIDFDILERLQTMDDFASFLLETLKKLPYSKISIEKLAPSFFQKLKQPNFNFLMQQDIVDVLDQIISKIPNLFESWKRLTTNNRTCNNCSTCFEDIGTPEYFYRLPLSKFVRSTQEKVRLEDLLEENMQPVTVEYTCSKCDEKGSAQQTERFNLPEILVFQLGRFSNSNNQKVEKLGNHVEIPFTLDFPNVDGSVGSSSYFLRSIVLHSGSYECGHYRTMIVSNKETQSFIHYNDDNFDKITYNQIDKSEPYIMVYTKSSPKPISDEQIGLHKIHCNFLIGRQESEHKYFEQYYQLWNQHDKLVKQYEELSSQFQRLNAEHSDLQNMIGQIQNSVEMIGNNSFEMGNFAVSGNEGRNQSEFQDFGSPNWNLEMPSPLQNDDPLNSTGWNGSLSPPFENELNNSSNPDLDGFDYEPFDGKEITMRIVKTGANKVNRGWILLRQNLIFSGWKFRNTSLEDMLKDHICRLNLPESFIDCVRKNLNRSDISDIEFYPTKKKDKKATKKKPNQQNEMEGEKSETITFVSPGFLVSLAISSVARKRGIKVNLFKDRHPIIEQMLKSFLLNGELYVQQIDLVEKEIKILTSIETSTDRISNNTPKKLKDSMELSMKKGRFSPLLVCREFMKYLELNFPDFEDKKLLLDFLCHSKSFAKAMKSNATEKNSKTSQSPLLLKIAYLKLKHNVSDDAIQDFHMLLSPQIDFPGKNDVSACVKTLFVNVASLLGMKSKQLERGCVVTCNLESSILFDFLFKYFEMDFSKKDHLEIKFSADGYVIGKHSFTIAGTQIQVTSSNQSPSDFIPFFMFMGSEKDSFPFLQELIQESKLVGMRSILWNFANYSNLVQSIQNLSLQFSERRLNDHYARIASIEMDPNLSDTDKRTLIDLFNNMDMKAFKTFFDIHSDCKSCDVVRSCKSPNCGDNPSECDCMNSLSYVESIRHYLFDKEKTGGIFSVDRFKNRTEIVHYWLRVGGFFVRNCCSVVLQGGGTLEQFNNWILDHFERQIIKVTFTPPKDGQQLVGKNNYEIVTASEIGLIQFVMEISEFTKNFSQQIQKATARQEMMRSAWKDAAVRSIVVCKESEEKFRVFKPYFVGLDDTSKEMKESLIKIQHYFRKQIEETRDWTDYSCFSKKVLEEGALFTLLVFLNLRHGTYFQRNYIKDLDNFINKYGWKDIGNSFNKLNIENLEDLKIFFEEDFDENLRKFKEISQMDGAIESKFVSGIEEVLKQYGEEENMSENSEITIQQNSDSVQIDVTKLGEIDKSMKGRDIRLRERKDKQHSTPTMRALRKRIDEKEKEWSIDEIQKKDQCDMLAILTQIMLQFVRTMNGGLVTGFYIHGSGHAVVELKYFGPLIFVSTSNVECRIGGIKRNTSSGSNRKFRLDESGNLEDGTKALNAVEKIFLQPFVIRLLQGGIDVCHIPDSFEALEKKKFKIRINGEIIHFPDCTKEKYDELLILRHAILEMIGTNPRIENDSNKTNKKVFVVDRKITDLRQIGLKISFEGQMYDDGIRKEPDPAEETTDKDFCDYLIYEAVTEASEDDDKLYQLIQTNKNSDHDIQERVSNHFKEKNVPRRWVTESNTSTPQKSEIPGNLRKKRKKPKIRELSDLLKKSNVSNKRRKKKQKIAPKEKNKEMVQKKSNKKNKLKNKLAGRIYGSQRSQKDTSLFK